MTIFTKFGNGQRPRTVQDWQALVGKMSRHERDRYWPGMHKDLIPDYEMIQDQEVASRLTRGPWDSAKSAYSGIPATSDLARDAELQHPVESVSDGLIPLEGAPFEQYVAIKQDPKGADVTNLSPEILATYDDIEAVWAMYTDVEPVITSGRDSHEDDPTSLHNVGQAIDVRANNISDEISQKIADTLQARLGWEYDVGFEHFPKTPWRDHVHIEYDPD